MTINDIDSAVVDLVGSGALVGAARQVLAGEALTAAAPSRPAESPVPIDRSPQGRSVTLPSGTARCIDLCGRRGLFVVAAPSARGSIPERLRHAELALRALSAEDVLRPAGIGDGFRVEDIVVLQVAAPRADHDAARAWWRRRLIPEATIDCIASDGDGGVVVCAVFADRGQQPTSQRQAYTRDDVTGRVRVEAFELHVVEHCNLRCAHCCNTSPYLGPKTLSPAAIASTLSTMATAIRADVFKIMGGEPLLHPEITEVLRVVRESGVGDVVRLFTNGLLLHKMDDAFWRALDHLTVSSYDSAPVRPEHLTLIEEKARAFDVVLNVKPVHAFSQVMHNARRHDDIAVQETFERCWLRHRCLVARNGRFHACTRSAYLPDMHDKVHLTDPFDDPVARQREDSVALDDPNLADAIVELLSRTVPLNACRFCLGGDGPRERHTQLSREDVRGGRLRALPVVA